MASSTVVLRRAVDRYAPPVAAVVVAAGAFGVRSPLPGGLSLVIALAFWSGP
ncbi:hypothetical protein [Micromonospora avicenniae]|uniref:hypothetical protein n=1 Tax=Micromonospora avicenniae TaxID=1198245 RepID=UPI00343C96A8